MAGTAEAAGTVKVAGTEAGAGMGGVSSAVPGSAVMVTGFTCFWRGRSRPPRAAGGVGGSDRVRRAARRAGRSERRDRTG
ncbi:hypothetical protein GCM10018953_52720 [Streptosporangium nondiastaticum]